MSKILLDNIKDIKRKLSYSLRVNSGDIVFVEDSQQVSDKETVKDMLLMLVNERQADDNKNKIYVELIGIGNCYRFKFAKALFINHKYVDESGLHTLNIIGKCDISIKINNINSYSL